MQLKSPNLGNWSANNSILHGISPQSPPHHLPKFNIRDISTPSPKNSQSAICNEPRRIRSETIPVHLSQKLAQSSPALIHGITGDKADIDNTLALIKHTQNLLDYTYEAIGYSNDEKAREQSKYFELINQTSVACMSAANRKKTLLEQECEYVLQQSRLILSITEDESGLHLLSNVERALIFQELCGNTLEPSNSDSYAPPLKLRQKRTKLNMIFLKIFRPFVRILRQFVYTCLSYHLCQEEIGEGASPDFNTDFPALLPTRQEAENFLSLIDRFENLSSQFDAAIEGLKDPGLKTNDFSILVSSPRKPSNLRRCEGDSLTEFADPVSALRDVNYDLTRALRVSNISKVTSDVIDSVQYQTDLCLAEIEQRCQKVKESLQRCLEEIDVMKLSDGDISKIHEKQFASPERTSSGLDYYFDKQMLLFIKENPKQFGLLKSYLDSLDEFLSLLQQQRQSREQEKKKLLISCQNLWSRLDEDTAYTEKFMLANNSLSEVSLMNFQLELNRLHRKRSERIDQFISKSRAQLESLWEQLFYTPERRSIFPYYRECLLLHVADKEAVFAAFEQEIAKLEAEYSQCKPILANYERLLALIEDQKFLFASSKDPSRLMSKDSCRILINEERVRNRVTANLPRIFDLLKRQVAEYNLKAAAAGCPPFAIFAVDFMEHLAELQKEHLNSERESLRQYRLSLPTKNTLAQRRVSSKTSPTKPPPRDPQHNARSLGTRTLACLQRALPSLKRRGSELERVSPSKKATGWPSFDSTNSSSSQSLGVPCIALSNDPSPLRARASRSVLHALNSGPLRQQPLNRPESLSPQANVHHSQYHERLSQPKSQVHLPPRWPIRPSKESRGPDKENRMPSSFSLKTSDPVFESTIPTDDTTFMDGDQYLIWRATEIKRRKAL